MAIDRAKLWEAVFHHVGAEVALRLATAWDCATPSPSESDKDAGRAIAIAMATFPSADAGRQVDALTLFSVELASSDAMVLTPQDALSHPLLAEWTPTTFADAIGDCIAAGRVLACLGTDAPVYNHFELVEQGGEIRHGTATLTFETKRGSLRAVLHYGAPVTESFARSGTCTGDVLFAVGQHIREPGPPWIMATPEIRSVDDPGEAGPVLH